MAKLIPFLLLLASCSSEAIQPIACDPEGKRCLYEVPIDCTPDGECQYELEEK